MMFTALAMGGHIRVGMEDNVVYGVDESGKKIMATNMMLVERAANAVRAFGNEPATSAEARKMLSLPPLDHEAALAALEKVEESWVETEKQKLSGLSRDCLAPASGVGGK